MADHTLSLAPDLESVVSRIPEASLEVRGSREEIAEIVATIAERFQPERIVLFGSRAYGTPAFGSDVDLMVIMDTLLTPSEQATLIRDALPSGRMFPLDILVRTPARIAIGLAEGDFFIEDAIIRGITLYQRSGAMMTGQPSGSDDESEDDQRPGPQQATREWVEKAEQDLRSARYLLRAPDPFYDMACFHAQQSSEKHLKALLQEFGIRSPRTHKLDVLANLAAQIGPGIAFRTDDLRWLSEYAVAIRYPGARAGQADSERAIQIAEGVRGVVRAVLGLSTDLPEAPT